MAESERSIACSDKSTRSDTKRSSTRLKLQPLTKELLETVECLSISHQSALDYLKTNIDTLSYDLLGSIHDEITQGIASITQQHDNLKRVADVQYENDSQVIKEIDRVNADYKNVSEQLQKHMNDLRDRNIQLSTENGQSEHNTQQIVTDQLLERNSHRSKSSVTSYRSSRNSGSSRVSQSLKLMQAEAKAAAATKQAQLQVEIESQRLEEESLQLQSQIHKNKSLITQAKLSAELQAEQQREHIFAQAIAEEEGDDSQSLLRPPSKGDKTRKSKNGTQPELSLARANLPMGVMTPLRSMQMPTETSPITVTSTLSPVFDSLALAEAINTVRQRPDEPPMFHGDTLRYDHWKATFFEAFDFKQSTPGKKWLKLQQYVGGKAWQKIDGLSRRKTESAWNMAWKKLDQKYGKPEIVAEAMEEKLLGWPKIKANDGEQLEEFVDFLETCAECTSDLNLSSKSVNKKLIQKLPYQIAQKWTARATKLEKRHGEFPLVQEFIEFLTEESDAANSSLTKAYQSSAKVEKPSRTNNHDKNAQEKRAHTMVTETTQGYAPKCVKCAKAGHKTSDCFILLKMNRADQVQFIQENSLCFACLKPNHMLKDCRSPAKCLQKGCGQNHPTVSHDYIMLKRKENASSKQNHEPNDETNLKQGTNSGENASKDKATADTQQAALAIHNNNANTDRSSQIMSWTIPVFVSSVLDPQNETLVYALIDSGADNSFITSETLSKIEAEVKDTGLNMSTLTNTDGHEHKTQEVFGLRIRGYNTQKYVNLPNLYAHSKIPIDRNNIPTPESVRKWPHLRHLSDKLMPLRNDVEVGLLIGGNATQAFIPRDYVVGADNEPFAKLTDLGWSVMGDSANINSQTATVNMSVMHPLSREKVTFEVSDNFENKILKILGADFETLNTDEIKTISVEDIQFLKMMKEQIHKDSEGYIMMPLPLKRRLGLNKSRIMAMNRFKILQKKLKDTTFSRHYHSFMAEIITQGDAELVPDNEIDNPHSWYIPHFGVYHPKKPDKIRVVFDGAAKVGGTCLNDNLLQGPDQLNCLIGVLMRFRRDLVGVTCDIGRMFHQFRVEPEDRDYLRFLWFDEHGEIASYRMKIHIFGATSSPACATFGLRTLCDLSNNQSAAAKSFIKHNFYVDDGLISVPDIQSAKELVQDAISICKEGNLRLHKFSSNSAELLEFIPKSERNLQDVQCLEPDDIAQPTERTLGLLWSLKSDTFQFSARLQEKPATRRGVLSTISSIYDPLGFLSPYILIGKNILQDMCRIASSWDDPITGQLLSRWESWKSSLPDLSSVDIRRCYKPAGFGEISKAEIHHFSDASENGYGEVSYLRLVNSDNKVHCSLLMSKARVAPIKEITIPRLELQAAVTSSRVSSIIRAEISLDISEIFWTDSQVVLGYLKNTSKRFRVYVANRIQQVRDHSNPESWFYIPSDQNPADHASRGLLVNDLTKSNWFTGPEFLWQEPIMFPPQPMPVVTSEDLEVKVCSVASAKSKIKLADRLKSTSSWSTAVNAIQLIISKIYQIQNRSISNTDKHLNAVKLIIKSTQQDHFPEIEDIMNGKRISKASKLYNLNPFMDENGVMRVGGRLKNSSSIDYPQKHPVILPKVGHITDILLRHLHGQVAHQGRSITLAKVRSSGYWIVGAKRLISSLIFNCIACRRARAAPMVPQMASLPQERASQSPPFTYCGVDCFGPFIVKERRSELKRYGLMVTCLASRAVHVEVLDDMTTSSFINAIRNVIALRGPIREIRCDRGTNFVGASSELTQHGVLEFKFNPPTASHMGGVWERMIRSARNVLSTLLRKHGGRVNTASLRTLMYEVTAILNSRPLTAVDEESNPLSPNRLLTMKSDIIVPPPSEFDESDVYSRKHWRAVQYLANAFWQRWKSEYLSQLQTRQKWVETAPNVKTGSIVLIKDESTSRNQWPLAKIVECNVSSDKCVRSAKLLLGNRKNPKISNQYLTRPVSKLITLIEGE